MANAATKSTVAKKREPNIAEKTIQYIKESWAETKRATWPSWLDIRRLTSVVFAGIIFVTLYIYVLDMVLASITRGFITGGR